MSVSQDGANVSFHVDHAAGLPYIMEKVCEVFLQKLIHRQISEMGMGRCI